MSGSAGTDLYDSTVQRCQNPWPAVTAVIEPAADERRAGALYCVESHQKLYIIHTSCQGAVSCLCENIRRQNATSRPYLLG